MKIEYDDILFFDMDGTLVDTNFANYLSYKKAIQSVVQSDNDIPYNPIERFNRGFLKRVIPNMTETEYEMVIQQKEKYYKEHLPETKLNILVAEILTHYSKKNKTVLVTNCREDRALMTLTYHNLTNKFSHLFFRQTLEKESRINKYKNAISFLNVSPQKVVIFENEKQEIEDAILAGILNNNILSL